MTRKNAPPPSSSAALARFLADERGAAAVEYGILIALISIAIMGTIFTIGTGLRTTLYDAIYNALASL